MARMEVIMPELKIIAFSDRPDVGCWMRVMQCS